MALHIYSGLLAEIRTLAVSPSDQKKGVGRQLVLAVLNEAKQLGIPRVFTLTLVPSFFKSFGFHEVGMETLPEKVYQDCLFCSKLHHCDETALMKEISLDEKKD